jgi:hypothetical protein
VALRKLTELVRTGANQVLSRSGFEREKNVFYRYTDIGDVMVVSFWDGGTVPKGLAAEIGIGYSPRYHLEFLKDLAGDEEIEVPHWTTAMFNWRLAPPAAVSYALDRGQPWSEWWALGDRTAESAELLASVLADEVVPELTALESLEAQCAVITEPFKKISVGPFGWAPVLVRLGRTSRAEVEAAIDAMPADELFVEHDENFRTWARRMLDDLEAVDRR